MINKLSIIYSHSREQMFPIAPPDTMFVFILKEVLKRVQRFPRRWNVMLKRLLWFAGGVHTQLTNPGYSRKAEDGNVYFK